MQDVVVDDWCCRVTWQTVELCPLNACSWSWLVSSDFCFVKFRILWLGFCFGKFRILGFCFGKFRFSWLGFCFGKFRFSWLGFCFSKFRFSWPEFYFGKFSISIAQETYIFSKEYKVFEKQTFFDDSSYCCFILADQLAPSFLSITVIVPKCCLSHQWTGQSPLCYEVSIPQLTAVIVWINVVSGATHLFKWKEHTYTQAHTRKMVTCM